MWVSGPRSSRGLEAWPYLRHTLATEAWTAGVSTFELRGRWAPIGKDELRELVFDAWRMVVPKKLASLSDDELRELEVP